VAADQRHAAAVPDLCCSGGIALCSRAGAVQCSADAVPGVLPTVPGVACPLHAPRGEAECGVPDVAGRLVSHGGDQVPVLLPGPAGEAVQRAALPQVHTVPGAVSPGCGRGIAVLLDCAGRHKGAPPHVCAYAQRTQRHLRHVLLHAAHTGFIPACVLPVVHAHAAAAEEDPRQTEGGVKRRPT